MKYLILILATSLWYVTTFAQTIETQKEWYKRITDSLIKGTVKKSDYILHMGTNNLRVDSIRIASGYKFRPVEYDKYDTLNTITVALIKNVLQLSTIIYDRDLKVMAEMVNGNWRVNKNNIFTRNSDDSAFEVIDQYHNVVLNVRRSGKEMYVTGVFRTEYSTIVINNNGIEIFSNKEEKSQRFKDSVNTIKPIFRYTGERWHHSRLKQKK